MDRGPGSPMLGGEANLQENHKSKRTYFQNSKSHNISKGILLFPKAMNSPRTIGKKAMMKTVIVSMIQSLFSSENVVHFSSERKIEIIFQIIFFNNYLSLAALAFEETGN